MDSEALRFVVISGLVGVLAFSISYSLLVWRKRNRKSTSTTGLARFRGWFATSAIVGCLVLIVSLAVRSAISTVGQVSPEGIQVVRATDDMVASEVTTAEWVKPGDRLVRFHSPKLEGESAELNARKQRYEQELQALELQPLVPDPELVRLHQNAVTSRRGVSDSLDLVLASLDASERGHLEQVFSRRERLAEYQRDLSVVVQELRQAEQQAAHAKREWDRESSGALRNVLPESELNARKRDADHWALEVEKLISKQRRIDGQRKEIQEQLIRLEKTELPRIESLRNEHDRLRKEITRLDTEIERASTKLESDKVRSERQRTAEMGQLRFKVREAEAGLAGLANRLEVTAKSEGRVFYANTSGAAAMSGSPLLVVGPADGFRVRVRMPENHVAAMQAEGEITLDVGEDRLARRFPAKFRRALELPGEPGTMLAELDCQPSPEAVRAMAESSKLQPKFSWRFPLLTFWPFQLGLGLIGIGAVGWLLSGGRIIAEAPVPATVPEPAKVAVEPVPVEVQIVEAPVPAVDAIPAPAIPEPTPVVLPATKPVLPEVQPLPTIAEKRSSLQIVDLGARSPVIAKPVIAQDTPTTIVPATTEETKVMPASRRRPVLDPILAPLITGSSPVSEPRPVKVLKQEVVRTDKGHRVEAYRVSVDMPNTPREVAPAPETEEALASRFRQAIATGTVDADLLAQVELALANRGPMAVRTLRAEFRMDDSHDPGLRQLLERHKANGDDNTVLNDTVKLLERLGIQFIGSRKASGRESVRKALASSK